MVFALGRKVEHDPRSLAYPAPGRDTRGGEERCCVVVPAAAPTGRPPGSCQVPGLMEASNSR